MNDLAESGLVSSRWRIKRYCVWHKTNLSHDTSSPNEKFNSKPLSLEKCQHFELL